MRRHPITSKVVIPQRTGFGAPLGAAVLCLVLIGAPAAPAAATRPGETAAQTTHGFLQIRFTTPEPVVLPPTPIGDDRMAVLADVPADLAADPDLSSTRDLAMIRKADAVQAHDAHAQAALWAREEAQMQVQVDAVMRPPSNAWPPAVADSRLVGDPELTASTGDTRRAPTSAN